ncbi:cation acetate symporter [Rhodobacteraceae bacterium RKSG542]|uniref:VC_2705 family sodium/solute symporter n=1 Tax=Pseudovibrio flavus TaxID=2529854 RepID=UPI0012BD094D|nr:VC_2705 family sodium/solute symporter [Pseudovibrio flavus]MTI18823.1 cation acetate symporter [Pseudovibrio flavus]
MSGLKSFRHRPLALFIVVTVLLTVFLAFLAVMEQAGISTGISGSFLVFIVLGVIALIGAGTRSMTVPQFFVADRNVPAVYNGMALAGDWISGTAFLAMAGFIYLYNFDGLSYILGWTGGLVLVAVLIAPYFRKSGAYTLPEFLEIRFQSTSVGLVALLALVVCSLLFLVAQIYIGGQLLSFIVGLEPSFALYVTCGLALACTLTGGMRSVTRTQALQLIVLFLAYLGPVILVSAQLYGLPLPQVTYGIALKEAAELQQAVSPVSADQAIGFTAPFGQLGLLNFIAITLTVTVGSMCLPHLLMRFSTATSAYSARRSAAWALVFVGIIAISAPAYAAFVKLEVFKSVVGASFSDLPNWLFELGSLGLVQICGEPALSVDTAWGACSAIGQDSPLLLAQNISFSLEAMVLALPQIGGLPYVLGVFVVVGAICAALSTASALLLVLANAITQDLVFSVAVPNAATHHRLTVARALLIFFAFAAAYLCLVFGQSVMEVAVWPLTIAGSAFLPVLICAIWWRQCNKYGALGAMIVGGGLAGYYLVASHMNGAALWFGVVPEAASIFAVPLGFIAAVGISLVSGAPSSDSLDQVDLMRTPSGPEVKKEQRAVF